MNKNEIVDALEPLIKAFDDLGILYYIGGSVASSAYGISRTTLDVDMVLSLLPDHIPLLVRKLKSSYYIDPDMITDAIQKHSSFNLLHLATMLKIDVFILQDKPYPQKAFERKIQDKLDDSPEALSIYLCTPEDVILNKLEWYKAGGEVSERQWSDIIGVIKVQGDSLDKEYLKFWSKELEVFYLLEEAFIETGIKL